MTPTWTGKAGEPVPVELRHRRATTPTRGAPAGRCACGLPLAPGERVRTTGLCPTAVAERLTGAETAGAARERRLTVRWLRAMAETGDDPWMSYTSDALSGGEHATWGEANPEPPELPTGDGTGAHEPGALALYYDGSDYVIATSAADASAVWAAAVGEPHDDAAYGWTATAPDVVITVFATSTTGRLRPQSLTAAEWIEARGRCWLSSQNV